MSTNVSSFPPFKYFDNDLTLFQLVEFHFPYRDHIAKLRALSNKENLPGLYIEEEKERLKKDIRHSVSGEPQIMTTWDLFAKS